jgi:hypothetical protein
MVAGGNGLRREWIWFRTDRFMVADSVLKSDTMPKVSKPCRVLKYCPYGELVENFPLVGWTRRDAVSHNEFLVEQLQRGAYSGKTKAIMEQQVKDFDPKKFPLKIKKADLERKCAVFGHMCPVFFVSEAEYDME